MTRMELLEMAWTMENDGAGVTTGELDVDATDESMWGSTITIIGLDVSALDLPYKGIREDGDEIVVACGDLEW